MSKQTFKIGKSFIPSILVLSCSAALLLFAAVLAVSPVASQTSALVQTGEDGLSLVTNQTLDATIKPAGNGSLYVTKDTIVGGTNSQYGYEVYVSVNSSSVNDIYLNGDTTNTGTNQKINATTGTYDTPAALDITDGATWGYAIAGLGSFDATYNETNPASSAKFAAMPVIENKQLIHEVTTAAIDDETEIYYGIKADSSLEPGLYKTEILYTAVPKPAPMVAKAILGDNHNLNFIYDNLTYNVGDIYTDDLGQPTEITNIYTVPTSTSYRSDVPWLADSTVYDTIKSISFDTSFHDFEPLSIAAWFYELKYVESIIDIENLNTSQVNNMEYLFYYLGSEVSALDMGNITALDFRNVINLHGTFYGVGFKVTNLSLNLDNVNFASAATMQDMFDNFGYQAVNITMSLKNWNVPNLVSLRAGFWDTGLSATGTVSIDVSGWTLGSLRDFYSAFCFVGYGASSVSLIGLSDWDMHTVTNAERAFESVGRNATTFTLTIEGWNLGTDSGVNTKWMFYNVGENSTGDVTLNLSGWTLGSASTEGMFVYAGGHTSTRLYADLRNWTFTSGSLYKMLYEIGSSRGDHFDWIVDVSGWNFGNVVALTNLFFDTGYGAETYTLIGLNTWNVSNIATMEGMFGNAGPTATTWDIGDISGWDVGNVRSMQSMFWYAGSSASTWTVGNLGFVDANHPGWNVSNVTSMSSMFYNAGHTATNWSIGDISGWNVGNVTDYSSFINPTADYGPSPNFANASVVMNQPHWQ